MARAHRHDAASFVPSILADKQSIDEFDRRAYREYALLDHRMVLVDGERFQDGRRQVGEFISQRV
jgi:hypothetical protein